MEETIPRSMRDRIEKIGAADLVVGIAGGGAEINGAVSGAQMVRTALGELAMPARAVVMQTSTPNGDASIHTPDPDASSGESPADTSVFVIPAGSIESDAPVQSVADVYRSVLSAGARLGARACCVVASSLETVTSHWFYLLTQPVLELGFDLVTPCYAHHTFEGLLNTSIVSPLHRALYGQQIQNPTGPDLGFSQRAAGQVSRSPNATRAGDQPLVGLTPAAAGAGLKICQAYLGRRLYPPADWSNMSSLLMQVLDPIFADIDRNAAVWQRIRGSRAVDYFGEPLESTPDSDPPDIARMIESFHLGIRDLREIWSLVLPPSSLFELTKLSRLPQDQFRMPDQLWARVVYDFALGHRLRTISRDHLLRAMTPLYLGWVASYALELNDAASNGIESPHDRLGAAFEAAKPYFVSRWRWPDRFNP
jgi:glucosylglycerate synthase